MLDADVVVYTKTNCPQCYATTRYLDREGIAYQTRDLDTDPDAYQHASATLGYQAAPVVETPNGHWSGFRIDKLQALSRERETVAL